MLTLNDDGAAVLELDPTQRVDVRSTDAVAHWTHRLACTEAELRDACAKVGPDVEDVENYLLARRYGNSLRGRRRWSRRTGEL